SPLVPLEGMPSAPNRIAGWTARIRFQALAFTALNLLHSNRDQRASSRNRHPFVELGGVFRTQLGETRTQVLNGWKIRTGLECQDIRSDRQAHHTRRFEVEASQIVGDGGGICGQAE